MEEECRRKRQILQRRAVNNDEISEVPPIVHEVLRSPGHPLDSDTRGFMEPRFNHDFSTVRVHTDEEAAESARAMSALAYTVGQNVVFGERKYAPSTHAGRELLAHELAHTIQQRNAGGASASADRNDVFEASANAVARSVANGGNVSRNLPACGLQIQRSPDSDPRWKNSVTAARYRGQIMANRIRKHGKLSREARAKINSELAYFEGAAKEAYLKEVRPALLAVTEIEMPERFLEELEVIVRSPRILVDAVQHPEEQVILQLWSSAPFPPVMDFSAQLIVEREEIGAEGQKEVIPVAEQILPWKEPVKLGFTLGVTAQKPGLHRVTLKVLDNKQQVLQIIRQTFEVETTIPQDLASLKHHPQYADSVVEAYYDPDRGPKQPGPSGKYGLSTWIPVKYADGTIIVLNFSDFSPGGGSATPFRWDNGKIFPEDITPVSAPNLTAIKKAVDKWIDDYNVTFISQAFLLAVYPTITGVPLHVGPAPEATIPTAQRQRPRAAAPGAFQAPDVVTPSRPVAGFARDIEPKPAPVVVPPGGSVSTQMPPARVVQGNQPTVGNIKPAFETEGQGPPATPSPRVAGFRPPPKDIAEKPGLIEVETGSREYVKKEYLGDVNPLGEQQSRYHVNVQLDQRGMMDADFVLRGGGKRSGSLFGKDEFIAAKQHFEQKNGAGSVKGAYGRWSGGDNLDTFNTRYKVATDKGLPHDEAMIEAARKTKTGEWSKAAGFNNVKITKAEGSPGAYTSVEVEFTK